MLYLSYSKRRLVLLPAPFASKCTNYRTDDTFVSRDWCHRSCLLRQLIARNESVHGDMPYFQSDPNMPLANLEIGHRLSSRLHDSCARQCPLLACTIENVFGHEQMTINDDSKETGLALLLPTEADMVIFYNPAMSLTTYFTFIGSILGLWLGFSALKMYEYVARLVTGFGHE